MMKKLLSLLMILTVFAVTPLLVRAEEVTPAATANANIEKRATKDNLPLFFVKDSEVATYEYNDEIIPDFRKYFNIWDQRTDILKMNNRVDGVIQSIDLGGYVWNLEEFDITTLGKQEISISYTGITGVIVQEKQEITVIEKDVTPPVIYGIFSDNVEFDLGQDFSEWIRTISAVDNVDGVIQLSLENFTDYEGIATGELNSVHNVILEVSDKAGNKTTRNLVITLKDKSAPLIFNAVNIEAKKGKTIDYTSHVYAEDNLTPSEQIVLKYTIVTDQTGKVEADKNEIDFNTVGEYYVKVEATDLSGLSSNAVYRVIVKNSISLITFVLIINGGVLLVAGATFGIVTWVKSSNRKKEV